MPDTPVKLDAQLKKKVEQHISRGENRFEYPSLKNFVDKAVLRLLKDAEAQEAKKKYGQT